MPKLLTPAQQKRVQAEHDELSTKVANLNAFITGPDFNEVDQDEKDRLVRQLASMSDYLQTLKLRIVHFPTETERMKITQKSFYAVASDDELIAIMVRHIERLQNKVGAEQAALIQLAVTGPRVA